MKNKVLPSEMRAYILVSFVVIIMSSCVSTLQVESDLLSKTPLRSATTDLVAATTSTLPRAPTVVPTSSPIPESTWTPLPTLHPSKIDSFIESMYTECDLPCWGRIIPGKTSEQEAKQLVSSFGTVIESTSVYFEYQGTPAIVDLSYEDGMVVSINLPPELTMSYKLNNLLTRYGSPEEVSLEVIPETADGMPWYYLVVVYPEKGILAIFSGEARIMDGKIHVCPQTISPDLYLVSLNKASLEEMNNMLDPVLLNMLDPLDSITGINNDQFYDIYSQPLDQCMTTTVQVP